MPQALANVNPIRYRGYYYDTETGLYYLQSRYYNPQWGRFLNADDMSVLSMPEEDDILATNLFAYCGNNSVNHSDPSGYAKIRCANLQGTYHGKKACMRAITSLILTTYAVTYAFFSTGKQLITIGAAGQIFSINLSSAITIPMIIGGFLLCTGSVSYATYMATTIINAIIYTRKYKKFTIKRAWRSSLFTYSVKKA